MCRDMGNTLGEIEAVTKPQVPVKTGTTNGPIALMKRLA